jgi:Mor family transcriptional regulator
MAIADIDRWLASNRDFKTGKSIYLEYGTNESFKTQLNLKETSFLRKKLLSQLRALNDVADHSLTQKATIEISETLPPEELPVFTPPTPLLRGRVNTSQLSTFVASRDSLRKRKWAQLSEYRKLLNRNAESKKDLESNKSLIKKIKILDGEISRLWDEVKYYISTGEELLRENEVNLPIYKLLQLRNNTRTYVSRYKDVPGKESKYRHYSNELIRLNNLIDVS